jgi:hypothetical protein
MRWVSLPSEWQNCLSRTNASCCLGKWELGKISDRWVDEFFCASSAFDRPAWAMTWKPSLRGTHFLDSKKIHTKIWISYCHIKTLEFSAFPSKISH